MKKSFLFISRYTNYTGGDAEQSDDEEEYEDDCVSYTNKSLDKQAILKEEQAWNTRF
jgi:hypothetical protein